MTHSKGWLALCRCVVALVLLSIAYAQESNKEVCAAVRDRPRSKMPYRNAVCAMVHQDVTYIREWIEYHYMLKFEHFYIYNNGSVDNIDEVLKPYIEKGIVSLLHWENNRTVDEALVVGGHVSESKSFCIADCIYNHHHEAQWIGMWDIDEFLYIDEKYSDFPDFVHRFIGQGPEAIRIPTATFGFSNHSVKPEGLVIENYTWRSNKIVFGYDPECAKFTGKSIYRSGCPSKRQIHHVPNHCKVIGDSMNFATSPPKDYPIHFKHYLTKSTQEFGMKMSEWGQKRMARQFGEVEDEQMLKYVPYLKSVLSCNL